MSEMKWFVASVRSCQERKAAEELAAAGVQTYVPVQKVERKWSDRIKIIDRLVLPGLVFVRCDERTRLDSFDIAYGRIRYYLVDHSCTETRRPLVVPEQQMEDFMRVVRAFNGEDELEVVSQKIVAGDRVRVIKGPLTGFICECAQVQNSHKLIIRLGELGTVLVSISASDVIKSL